MAGDAEGHERGRATLKGGALAVKRMPVLAY
jgi:hypothetical protein